MPVTQSLLPIWAQAIAYIIIALGAATLGILKYVKTEEKPTLPSTVASAAIISASLIDSKLLKELIEALREFQDEQAREQKKTHRLIQDLRESMNELNESMIISSDTTMNLIRFINRETNKNRLSE